MKSCKRCLVEKPLSEFNKQAKTKDGFQSVCRACVKELREVPEIKERDYKKAKERDQSPEGRAKRTASRSAHLAIPGNKEKKVEWFKDHYQKPEIKAASAERYLKNIEIPGFKEKRSAEAKIKNATDERKAMNAANNAAYMAIPGNKERLAAHNKKRNALPEIKAINKIKGAAYHAAHPDQARIRSLNRRARKKANGGKLSKGLRLKLFTLQRGCCAICKKKLDKLTRLQHLDHIIALILGGANEDWNIQLLCQRCNLEKSSRDNIKHMQSLGYLL